MFDPTIGRWQTKDPKSFDAGDTNLYRYVGNHPSYATDPSGLEEPYVGPSIEILNSH
ncbi:MAG: RHS repeat-associated core domain-containing protein, partial [Exiguobacterium acetylicum]